MLLVDASIDNDTTVLSYTIDLILYIPYKEAIWFSCTKNFSRKFSIAIDSSIYVAINPDKKLTTEKKPTN